MERMEQARSIIVIAIFPFAATGVAVVVGVSLFFANRLMDHLWELNRPGEALFRSMGRLPGAGCCYDSEDPGTNRRHRTALRLVGVVVVLFAIVV